ncbi:MAG: DUF4910 domain-containing protein [Euryarchaeota archaeon]|nr:DUF4910 domain-containing protein [Euryarchaeota archaeon]
MRHTLRVLPALLLLLPALGGCSFPTETVTPPHVNGSHRPDVLFDEDLAFEALRHQVERVNGTALENYYRIPGTEGNDYAANIIAARLSAIGTVVTWDNFTGPYAGNETRMHNVVGRLGTTPRTVYLAAHYDTRPWADEDPDPRRRSEPVLGANDGASGVAVLLELARVLSNRSLNFSVTFLFFDGEDGGRGGDGWIVGSTHYASNMTTSEVANAMGFVLLDMVGDPELSFLRESTSANGPGKALQDLIWAEARRQNATQFVNASGGSIIDDHAPFLARGIKAVDVIHLDKKGSSVFPDSHHTTFDDLEHVSAKSLGVVGRIIEGVIHRIDQGEAV